MTITVVDRFWWSEFDSYRLKKKTLVLKALRSKIRKGIYINYFKYYKLIIIRLKIKISGNSLSLASRRRRHLYRYLSDWSFCQMLLSDWSFYQILLSDWSFCQMLLSDCSFAKCCFLISPFAKYCSLIGPSSSQVRHLRRGVRGCLQFNRPHARATSRPTRMLSLPVLCRQGICLYVFVCLFDHMCERHPDRPGCFPCPFCADKVHVCLSVFVCKYFCPSLSVCLFCLNLLS